MENCYIAIGAIVKNEGRYIEEWIEYHRLIGVEKFYIVDNGSTDDTVEKLNKYVLEEVVELYEIGGSQMQLKAYNAIVEKHKEDTKWIAFIDADEYIYVSSGELIGDFLSEYEKFNGLGVNWRCVGPSGYVYSVKGSVIEHYTQMLDLNHDENNHIKSIVQPAKVKEYNGQPHAALYKDGKPCVDENFEYIYGNESRSKEKLIKIAFTEKHLSDKIAIIHYNTKSEEECYYRSMKGKACGIWDDYNVYLRFVSLYKDNETFEFNGMKKYVSKINEKIDKNKVMYSVSDDGIQDERLERNSTTVRVIQKGIIENLARHKILFNPETREDVCIKCQEMAITIGELVENLIKSESNTVKYLEEYCELLYKICEENVVTNQYIDLLNMTILKAGYSLIK